MKKNRIFLAPVLIAFLLLLFCCKKKNEEPPVQPAKYTVEYSCDVTGAFLDLKVTYYTEDQEYREVSVEDVPWSLQLDDFNYGDSVYIGFTCKIPPSATSVQTGWEWGIKASSGSSFLIDASNSFAGSGIVTDTIYVDQSSGFMTISQD